MDHSLAVSGVGDGPARTGTHGRRAGPLRHGRRTRRRDRHQPGERRLSAPMPRCGNAGYPAGVSTVPSIRACPPASTWSGVPRRWSCPSPVVRSRRPAHVDVKWPSTFARPDADSAWRSGKCRGLVVSSPRLRGGALVKLKLTPEQHAVFQAIGAEAYTRAQTVAERGAVVQVTWHGRERSASAVVLGDPPASVRAVWRPETATIDGTCTCRRSRSCDHRAALILLTMNDQPVPVSPDQAEAASPTAWEREIEAWLGGSARTPVTAGVPSVCSSRWPPGRSACCSGSSSPASRAGCDRAASVGRTCAGPRCWEPSAGACSRSC